MGDFEAGTPVYVESPLKYRLLLGCSLTFDRYPVGEQCLVGSLTGVVASKIVTEAFKGTLSTFGNRA